MKIILKIFLISLSFIIYPLFGQSPVKYSISFPNASHHEAQVTLQFIDTQSHQLELLMSRSSPGRYSLHEFAKNVYNVQAFDVNGKKLDISRPNVYQWNVKGTGGTITVKYTIFGDQCDGTYLAIDNTHAHMNMPATFMWAKGYEENSIEVRFDVPDPKWKVATQLKSTDEPYKYTAPNLDYFMDSPTEISDFKQREWTVQANGKNYTLRLVMHDQGKKSELDAYEKITRAIVDTQINIMGEPADFDYGHFSFICCFLPYAKWDAMEHRNSTIFTGSGTLNEDVHIIIDGISHEFFHTWNIERIRPRSLQPFDFSRTNISEELWFGEGFTNYYSKITMSRAGILSLDNSASHFSGLLNYVLNSPAMSINNTVQMSQYAPIVDAGHSNDPKNLTNTYISYYPLGEAIALGLDLMIRKTYQGLSLDDYMKAVWQKFGKNEKSYTNTDLEQLLADVTGSKSFADNFFNKYIYGHTLPEFDKLLPAAGLILQNSKKDSAWIGNAKITFKDSKMTISSATQIGSPLYMAGLDNGDIIVKIERDSITNEQDWMNWLNIHKPGDEVEIIFNSRDVYKTAKLILQGNPALKVIPFEHQSKELTAEIKSFRHQWLGIGEGMAENALQRFCPKCRRSFPFRFEFCRYDGSNLKVTLP